MLFTKILKKTKNFIPIISGQLIKNEWIFTTLPEYLLINMLFLKHHISFQFKILSCISGIDFLGKDYRFCVSYDLLSITFSQRVRIKTFVNEIMPIFSITPVFINSNWWEREIWDLYGIFFENHPDLRRILSDYGFEGYPMRKDFPLYGYIELRYDENHKRIVAEPVEFAQEFRFFDFETPW